MLRLFVGISLPPEQRLMLSAICRGLPGAKWVDPGNYHVTLRFIGETDEGMAADIHEALERVRAPRFDLVVAGAGVFGTDVKARTLYAGVERSAPLTLLHDRIAIALGRAGLPPELRRFQPHVTLARFKSTQIAPLTQFVAAHNLLRLAPIAVRNFSLIRSHLAKSGAIYEEVADYPLGPERA